MQPGTTLGPYEVLAKLGEGGMGEVYLARDTRLSRQVAIKFLSRSFADPLSLQRFQQEAQTASSLNHPHILTVFEVGEWDGRQYLVTEFVDGGTLRDWMHQDARSWSQVAELLVGVADALAAAHAAGILHRDIKPDNVFVAKNGYAKLADFGLAKSVEPHAMASGAATVQRTDQGVVVGTIAYMSPEQAAGKPLDARSDIFSFGILLHELLAGERPFTGHSDLEVLQTILHGAPSALGSNVPFALRLIVEKALEKDPADRYQTMRELVVDLRRIVRQKSAIASNPSVAAAAVAPPPRRMAWLPWTVAGVALTLAVGVAAVALSRSGRPTATARQVQFNLSLSNLPNGYEPEDIPFPSPDGQYLAVTATAPERPAAIFVRRLDDVDSTELVGTEGVFGTLTWSPDGQWIGFWSSGKLKKIHPTGGPAQTIADIPGFQDATWGPQGVIVYRTTNRAALFRIADTGGAPTPATTLNQTLTENSHRYPEFLPDGRRFLYVSRCGQRENNALYVASLDSHDVTRIMAAEAAVRFVPSPTGGPGSIFFYRDGALFAQPFDVDKATPIGDPTPVLNNIAYTAASILAGFHVSNDGSVVLAQSAAAANAQLQWFDRTGKQLGVLGSPSDVAQPRISPDGTRVAFTQPDPKTGNRDVWTTEIGRGTSTRLTTDVANDWYPVWSPDSKQLLFASDRDGGPALPPFLKQSLDVGAAEMPVPNAHIAPPHDWSSDGRWMTSGSDDDIWVKSMTGDGKPFKFLGTPFREAAGFFSPDVRWILYVSNETGRREVFVRPFAGVPATNEGRIQVSIGGGDFPLWGPKGNEVFYIAPDSTAYAVSLGDVARANAAPNPVRLFQACAGMQLQTPPDSGNTYFAPWTTLDGERFLIDCRIEPPGQYRVVLNWKEPRQ